MGQPIRKTDRDQARHRQDQRKDQRPQHMRHRQPREAAEHQTYKRNRQYQRDVARAVVGGGHGFSGQRAHRIALNDKEQQRHRGHHKDDPDKMLRRDHPHIRAGLFGKGGTVHDAAWQGCVIGIQPGETADVAHDHEIAAMGQKDERDQRRG